MSEHHFAFAVALAPGSGLIARREQTLLFVPEPDDRAKPLLDAFTHGHIDGIWERLAEAVIDQGFDVCAFACVIANTQIEIRVFGDIELKTDLRSVPMLSGAASGTWVEHRVPGQPRSASITTVGNGIDDRTTLVDGIVHAGGFTAAIVEQRLMPSETIAIPSADASITIPPSDDVATTDDLDAEEIGEESHLVSYVNKLADEHEADEGVAAPTPPEPTIDDITARPPMDSIRPTLAARVCKAGHANAPSRAACEVCDVFLPAGPDGVSVVPRPSLGTLVFDDGRRVDLDTDVMIGRNPSRSGDHWIPVVVEGERISRTHLTVRCSSWDVLVEDAGSHNGSVVIPADGSQPVALVAGTAHLIEPGATVYFGASSFRFEGRVDTTSTEP